MKKVLKIAGIVLLALVVALVGFLFYQGQKKFVPNDYTTTVPTGGPVEAQFLAMGPHNVATQDFPLLQSFEKYTMYYPARLEAETRRWPVVVICNGSGLPASKYPAL